MQAVPVWDLATRVFHWTLVAAVTVALLTGEDEGFVFLVHVLAGYLVLMLLLFRFGWGLVGSRHSRFSDFVYGARAVRAYTGRLLRFKPPRVVGHNPLGGWMVVLMLAVLSLVVLTGLFSGGEEGQGGAVLILLPAGRGEAWSDVHEVLGNFVIVLVAIHVLGVLTDWLLTGENLIRAMITGRKDIDETAAEREMPLASSRRALIVAALSVAAGGYLLANSDLSAARNGDSRREPEERETEDDD